MSRTKRKVFNGKYVPWMRYPKTFQEIKDSEACRVDGVKKRKARAKKRLPTAWDDMPVAALKEKIKKHLDL